MATKSPRSPGSQFTSKGVVQGTALTSPIDGQPVAVIIDGAGVHRLAVDADLTADNITVDTRDLSFTTDSVTVGDSNTGAILKINADGSIDTNTSTTAFGPAPDSELIVGTEDGTVTGIPHVVKVNPDGSLAVNFSVATTPVIANVLVATANTEYSYAFPANTKEFSLNTRGMSKMQVSFTSGQTNSNYLTVYAGSKYEESNISLTSTTVYFQLNKAGDTVEILSWT